MNYENAPCPVCGRPLSEGDDIVVCPVCATPQHRECWMENGRCANDDLHASGYIWNKNSSANYEEPAVTEELSDVKACHVCNSENPADALHCGNCGALFGQTQEPVSKKCAFCGKENSDDALHCNQCGAPLNIAQGNAGYIAGTDIPADEKIGENAAGDLATYVQASAHRYIRKFKKFESGKKISFNFAAFFFAPYWFFYRKLYKAGAFFLVAFVTASILLSGLTGQITAAVEEYSVNVTELGIYEEMTDEQLEEIAPQMEKYASEMIAKTKNPLLITAAVALVLRLICALAANRLYYKKILDDLKLINETVQASHMRRMMIAHKGGLAPLAFAASLLGETMLINILYYTADFIREFI
ncbi:MAG: DUF2628 domain-containing protein [Clostridia bacterium]|nr:DUF2628 domain-containing protein [Clostridia bacterium]